MDQVLKVFNDYKRRKDQRAEWFKTDEGKAYNRMKAKEYYLRNKDKVLEKRAKRYDEDKETLLNRAKEYYKIHAEDINARARAARAGEVPA